MTPAVRMGRSNRGAGLATSWWALAFLVAPLVGCDDGPDDGELDRLLEEVRSAETAAQAAHATEDESAGWTLSVVGLTGDGRPDVLSYADITGLPVTEVHATPPLEGAVAADFAGPSIAAIIEHAGGANAGVEEVTLFASDGFRATMSFEDVGRYPILLATHRDGDRLAREHGGPLLAVFPLTTFPELAERYTESWWVYYVTHIVVGTEVPYLRVGTAMLDAAALAALPTRSITASVGYRVGWPSEPATITGPSLATVLVAAGADLGSATSIRVLGHAPITRSAERPTRVAAADVASGDVILGLAYGDPPAPIPARLGGPLVLCFTDEVATRQNGHDWLTFVDELVVERGEAADVAPTEAAASSGGTTP